MPPKYEYKHQLLIQDDDGNVKPIHSEDGMPIMGMKVWHPQLRMWVRMQQPQILVNVNVFVGIKENKKIKDVISNVIHQLREQWPLLR